MPGMLVSALLLLNCLSGKNSPAAWLFDPLAPPSLAHKIYLPIIRDSRSAFYVAMDGSDQFPGTAAAPWRTLQYAADHALPGSTIQVRPGAYAPFRITRSRLTFLGDPQSPPAIEGDGQTLNTIKIDAASSIVIQGFILQNNTLQYGTGINAEDASNLLLTGNTLRDNQGFGIVLKNVKNVTVEKNDIAANGNGIEVRYGSQNVVLNDNQIYNNYRVIDSGRSAVGITFYRTTGPIVASNNRLWANHSDNLLDPAGVAFEVYAASNITMTGNVVWDNETVLETGTDDDKTPCDRLTFTRNVAYRGQRQQGLILRCASNSLFAHNTFDGLDNFVFNLSHNHGSYGASIAGLQIINNIAVNGRVYAIDSSLPAGLNIDHNLFYNPGSSSVYGQYLAYVTGKGNSKSLAEFQTWTGYDLHSLYADPLLINPPGRDYSLTPTSPAVDQGAPLGRPFCGSAPDLGRFEFILPGCQLPPLPVNQP